MRPLPYTDRDLGSSRHYSAPLDIQFALAAFHECGQLIQCYMDQRFCCRWWYHGSEGVTFNFQDHIRGEGNALPPTLGFPYLILERSHCPKEVTHSFRTRA